MVKKKANRKPRDQNTSRCVVESDEDRDPSMGIQHCGFNRLSEEGRERPKVHHQVQHCCEPKASVEAHHLSSIGQSTPHYLTGDPSNHSGNCILPQIFYDDLPNWLVHYVVQKWWRTSLGEHRRQLLLFCFKCLYRVTSSIKLLNKRYLKSLFHANVYRNIVIG